MDIHLDTYVSGEFEQDYKYKAFLPTKINARWLWQDPELDSLLEKAAVRLGELNALSRLVADSGLFIRLLVMKEAVMSSRIEGTQTNFEEALLPEAEIKPERRDDWQEVTNYVHALNSAIDALDALPISSRLFRNTHKILMSGVRGKNKLPGDYRQSQNWIGGSNIENAIFVPPTHSRVSEYMGDLENFLHNKNIHIPVLVRIAIAHYQFETIHPFLDGNGRIGRLMIPLYLISEGVLDSPLLYLSAYFEENKNLYYDGLTKVRANNDMTGWLKYFLHGIEKSSKDAIEMLGKILKLKAEIEANLSVNFGRRAGNAGIIVNSLFRSPWVNVDDVSRICQITYDPANKLVALMCEKGILKEVTGQSRNRLFLFEPYMELFR